MQGRCPALFSPPPPQKKKWTEGLSWCQTQFGICEDECSPFWWRSDPCRAVLRKRQWIDPYALLGPPTQLLNKPQTRNMHAFSAGCKIIYRGLFFHLLHHEAVFLGHFYPDSASNMRTLFNPSVLVWNILGSWKPIWRQSGSRTWFAESLPYSIARGVKNLHVAGRCADVKYLFTDMRRLTTGIPSVKCVFRRFRRCANVYLYKPR